MLHVDVPSGRRLARADAAVVRQAIGDGQEVVFADRHQWRHFMRSS